MIFPIGDTQVKGGYFPFFSYGFIILNVLFFFYQQMFPGLLVCQYGSIPNNIMAGEDYITLFTSIFMHAHWMHLFGNMLFLWVFADNIEATIGNIPFAVFYLLGALVASALHIFLNNSNGADLSNCCNICLEMGCTDNVCPGSVPSVGASGAISAVLGAYLIMFPRSKVKMFVFFFFMQVPAFLFLGFWIGQQLLSGFSTLGPEAAASGGTAWWAHIGGFVFGLIAGFFARNTKPKDRIRFRSKNDFV